MSDYVDKLRELELKLSAERGGFSLFALLKRTNEASTYDVVVAAPWLNHESKEDLLSIVDAVKATLTSDEIRLLSGIVILNLDHPVLHALQLLAKVEHGRVEQSHNIVAGLPLASGIIVTAWKR